MPKEFSNSPNVLVQTLQNYNNSINSSHRSKSLERRVNKHFSVCQANFGMRHTSWMSKISEITRKNYKIDTIKKLPISINMKKISLKMDQANRVNLSAIPTFIILFKTLNVN